jgi:hypothetical protein
MLYESLLAHPKLFFICRIIYYVIFVDRVACGFIDITEPRAKTVGHCRSYVPTAFNQRQHKSDSKVSNFMNIKIKQSTLIDGLKLSSCLAEKYIFITNSKQSMPRSVVNCKYTF